MNLDDTSLMPVGGGELRGPSVPSITKAAGTFTQTAIQDPDAVWNPRSREVGAEDQSTRFDPYRRPGTESERPVVREHAGADGALSFRDVATQTRAAVRPGLAG